MVIKICEDAPTCHRAGCTNPARLAYRGDLFPVYCSYECRRGDCRENRGTPWEDAWERSRHMIARCGRIIPGMRLVRYAAGV